MTALNFYTKEEQEDGAAKNTLKYKRELGDLTSSTGVGIVMGSMATFGSFIVGLDPFATITAATAVAALSGTGAHRIWMYSEIKNSLKELSGGRVEKIKPTQLRRTLKEKRLLLAENMRSEDGKSKVTRELVTNRHGIWVEETVTPIATTAVQVKSWDSVLDSIIKVHGLESIDKIASNTIPALSPDGQKLSWRRTAGNILGEIGILQECTNRNCSTQCNHFF